MEIIVLPGPRGNVNRERSVIESSTTANMNRRAMTLVEMIIAVVLVGGGLFLLVGWSRIVRDDAKTQLAAELLARLDAGLDQYRAATGVFPPTFNDDPDPVVAALQRHPRTRPLFDGVPDSLWTVSRPRMLVDPWGTRLKYRSDGKRVDVAANNGRPIFISAGRDRLFGDDYPAQRADDLRSDDPRAEGFANHATTKAAASGPALRAN